MECCERDNLRRFINDKGCSCCCKLCFRDREEEFDELNTFYANIGKDFLPTNLQSDISIPMIVNESQDNFELSSITMDNTLELIQKLNNKNFTGPDGISPVLVKTCSNEIASVIYMLIN